MHPNTKNSTHFLAYLKNLLPLSPSCAEIGVLAGAFSEFIYQILEPNKLILIDPWENGSDKNSEEKKYKGMDLLTAYSTELDMEYVEFIFSQPIKQGIVEIHKGFSYDVVDKFDDNSFDFIYIDATHLYDCVKADINMFLPKLKPNGLMCGHDYFEHPDFSVVQAVDEFVNNGILEWVALSGDNDWALKRKSN